MRVVTPCCPDASGPSQALRPVNTGVGGPDELGPGEICPFHREPRAQSPRGRSDPRDLKSRLALIPQTSSDGAPDGQSPLIPVQARTPLDPSAAAFYPLHPLQTIRNGEKWTSPGKLGVASVAPAFDCPGVKDQLRAGSSVGRATD